jgi:transposase
VRRDFLDLARSYPELKDWGLDWVETIGQLYELNQTRLDHWHSELVFEQQGLEFQQAHTTLKTHLQQMKARCDTRLQVMAQAKDTAGTPQSPEPYQPWHRAQRKVLRSLEKHWEGLTIFLAHPQVPLDNNAAEQAIRSPVTGRKNYYGSGSIWSAQLAAIMFSIFQTLGLWKLNTRHWLRAYLVACAGNGGQAPTRLNPFLPWEMGPRRRQQLSRPPDTS